MADKPRLKNADELLGKLATEPTRAAKKAGAASRSAADPKPQQQPSREAVPTPKAQIDDDMLDEVELSDGPVLPSAQSLAEKLMPKKSGKRKDSDAFAPSVSNPHVPTPKAAAAPSPTVEFSAPPKAAQASAPTVEFATPPAPARQAAIEFEAPDSPFQFEPAAPPAQKPTRTAPKNQAPSMAFEQEFVAPPKATSTVEFAPTSPPRQAAIEFQAPDAPFQFEPAAPPTPRPPARNPQHTPTNQPPSMAFEQEFAATPTISEYTFQSFEQPAAKTENSVREFSMGQGDEQSRQPRQRKRERQEEFEDFSIPNEAPPPPKRPEKIIQPMRPQQVARIAEPEQSAYIPEPTPQPATKYATPPPEPQMSEEERNRQEFLKRIEKQFEVQFEEKFEEGTLRPRDAIMRTLAEEEPRQPQRSQAMREEPPRRQAPTQSQEPPNEEDFLSFVKRQESSRLQEIPPRREPAQIRDEEAPALDFIERFQQDIRKEDEQREEDFKETLSQKFMRERERYLKELDFDDDSIAEPTAPTQGAAPQRRKLDFQIQPEMHMRDGDTPPTPTAPTKPATPTGPITYTRGGAAKSQQAIDEDDIPNLTPSPGGGKKSGEQLLIEHSLRSRAPALSPTPTPAKLKFTFATPDELAQKEKPKEEKEKLLPTEKWPRRIVIIAMVFGLVALGLLMWPLVQYYNLADRITEADALSSLAATPAFQETLNVYNNQSFDQTPITVNNVIFKNSGITLKNVKVNDYAIIEGIDAKGKIRLENVSVNNAISVKSSGVDALELHNVKAGRIIIDNPKADVTVTATGTTDISVIELRTKSTIIQKDIGKEHSGISGMVVTSTEPETNIEATLDGLNLRTLETNSANATLTFANDTRADMMSSDGSLSMNGVGKVTSLAIGSKAGLGAGDTEPRKDIVLFVKGVSITNLNVKSPANLNLPTTVDNLSTSDPITVGGEASIGTMTLNPKVDSTDRLLIDIVAAKIQTVYTNVPSRINVTGSSRINELTADESTYALGNKVNHLKVNAAGVIFENTPDKISLASGINPPQSKADNPNLNYDVAGAAPAATSTAGEDFATTCGHSRESGGFLLGDGSKDSPFEVSTPLQLAHVAAHLASHFKQTADIDVSTEKTFAETFPMIGAAGTPFEGMYDGKGFGISKLRVVSQAENIGLFASNKGIIQNVRLLSGDVSAASTSPAYVGGIVGLNYDGGQIRSSSNGATVNGNQNTTTGGVVGCNFGAKVHDCFNYAKISGVAKVGGLVGYNRDKATLTGSYNAGEVVGSDEFGSVCGSSDDAVIANCYFLTGTTDYGIFTGSGTATEKTAEELADPQMAADLAAGNESSLWVAGNAAGSYKFPTHKKPE